MFVLFICKSYIFLRHVPPDYFAKWIFRIALPFIVLAVLLIILLLLLLLKNVREHIHTHTSSYCFISYMKNVYVQTEQGTHAHSLLKHATRSQTRTHTLTHAHTHTRTH